VQGLRKLNVIGDDPPSQLKTPELSQNFFTIAEFPDTLIKTVIDGINF
jgi:hypothetical protein